MAPAPHAARMPTTMTSSTVEPANGVSGGGRGDQHGAADHDRPGPAAVGHRAGDRLDTAHIIWPMASAKLIVAIADAGGGVDRPDEQACDLAHAQCPVQNTAPAARATAR